MPTTRNDGVRIVYDVTLSSGTDVVAFVESWGYDR
jgi:hypothetical protein